MGYFQKKIHAWEKGLKTIVQEEVWEKKNLEQPEGGKSILPGFDPLSPPPAQKNNGLSLNCSLS